MSPVKLILTVLLVSQAALPQSLPAPVRTAADGITADRLAADLAFLSSDELRGRATPSPGFDKAADYIVNRLKAAGVKPAGDKGTYLQRYEMRESRVAPEASFIQIGQTKLALDDGFVLRSFAGAMNISAPVVYVGHGWVVPDKGIDPFAGLNVRDKIVLAHGPRAMPKGVTIQQLGRVSIGGSNVMDEAAKRGALAVLMIPQTSSQPGWWEQMRGQNLQRRELEPWVPSAYAAARINTALLSRASADVLLQGEQYDGATMVGRGDAEDYPASFTLKKPVRITIAASTLVRNPYNVVAMIEGADPKLKNEFITVEAHLDGAVGTRAVEDDNVYNAADDNASGSAAMLSIVEQLMKTARPRRSMIFIWDSGEEVGLWGTRHFVANPPVPLSSIVAHINIDMIGATRAPGTADAESPAVPGPNEVYLIGPGVLSERTNALIERVNREYLNMTLNRTDDRSDSQFFYPRTDAGPFLERGILTISWNTGLHRRYHQPSDEARYLDPVKIQTVARTIFATLWAMADHPERPSIDKPIPVSVPRYGGRANDPRVPSVSSTTWSIWTPSRWENLSRLCSCRSSDSNRKPTAPRFGAT